MKMLLLILNTLLLIGSVTASPRIISTGAPAAVYSNVAYGSDPKQVMDIYLPEGRNTRTTKLMFVFHGGSWSSGDKSGMTMYIDSLKNYLPDYAFVNVNYRLATFTANKFPAQETDVQAAIQFVMQRTDEYAVSKDVVLLGASSGAHLALLHAYKHTEPVKVKAVISFFGPTDIADLYTNPPHPQAPYLLTLLMNGTPAENREAYNQSSPVYFVNAGSSPTLILQGERDQLVNPRQATLLNEKLQQAGVAHELVLYPTEGHGWRGASLSDSYTRIRQFLKEHVND
jgi:acetyl esterase/lipase